MTQCRLLVFANTLSGRIHREGTEVELYNIYFLMINRHYFIIKIVEIKLQVTYPPLPHKPILIKFRKSHGNVYYLSSDILIILVS